VGAVTDIHEPLRLERQKVAKLDKQVTRLAREIKKRSTPEPTGGNTASTEAGCSDVR
jgi:hypothetical protein